MRLHLDAPAAPFVHLAPIGGLPKMPSATQAPARQT